MSGGAIVDLVWRYGYRMFTVRMDTLNTLLISWLAFVVLLVLIGKFLYGKFLCDVPEEYEDNPPKTSENSSDKTISNQDRDRKKPTIVPDGFAARLIPPVVSGGDPDAVRWMNHLLVWFYEGSEGGTVIKEAWNDALNEITVNTALETGVLIEVLEVLPATPSPLITNAIVDCQPNDTMTLTCDMTADIYVRVQATRTQKDITKESEYACAVTPLRGRVNAQIQPHASSCDLSLVGWPEIALELEGIRNNSTGMDEKQLQEVLKEVLTNAIRAVSLSVHFAAVDSFPRFKRARDVPDRVIPDEDPIGYIGLDGKRLLVKVVRATGIGGDKPVNDSYVVVEMDEPSQKFTTKDVWNGTEPSWDEQFVFDLSSNSLELLFEVFDKTEDRFLGLGIVGMEELVLTPSQRQVITLQPRPYEEDKVTGSLTCEFLFLERAVIPEINYQSSTTTDGKTITTTTTYSKDNHSDAQTNDVNNIVTETALRDLERRQPNAAQTKSTMIIHASRKAGNRNFMENGRASSEEYEEMPNGKFEHMNDPDHRASPRMGLARTPSPGRAVFPPAETLDRTSRRSEERNSLGLQTEDRGRNRQKTTFFGTLKKRFSRSKNRSQSMEPGFPGRDLSIERDPLAGRSASVERQARSREDMAAPEDPVCLKPNHKQRPSGYLHLLRSKGLLSVPGFRFRSSSQKPDNGSGTSSLSGTSGISSGSTKTYINEASMMIVESYEKGHVRHYLIPLSLQRKNKWRKKGTKLHIYNEHCFVAKHMQRSTECEVCSKTLGRSLGKQGYECRDCAFKCHKPCHVLADMSCPNSSIDAMNLIHVKDDKSRHTRKSS